MREEIIGTFPEEGQAFAERVRATSAAAPVDQVLQGERRHLTLFLRWESRVPGAGRAAERRRCRGQMDPLTGSDAGSWP
jgi:hypothetical protein